MPVKVHIESLTTDEFNCARRGRTDRMRGLANKHPDGHWRWWIQVRSVERRGAYGGRECIFWIDLIGHQDKGEGYAMDQVQSVVNNLHQDYGTEYWNRG